MNFLVLSKHYWLANTKRSTLFTVFLHFYFFVNSELTENLKISQKYLFIIEFPIFKRNTHSLLCRRLVILKGLFRIDTPSTFYITEKVIQVKVQIHCKCNFAK